MVVKVEKENMDTKKEEEVEESLTRMTVSDEIDKYDLSGVVFKCEWGSVEHIAALEFLYQCLWCKRKICLHHLDEEEKVRCRFCKEFNPHWMWIAEWRREVINKNEYNRRKR